MVSINTGTVGGGMMGLFASGILITISLGQQTQRLERGEEVDTFSSTLDLTLITIIFSGVGALIGRIEQPHQHSAKDDASAHESPCLR